MNKDFTYKIQNSLLFPVKQNTLEIIYVDVGCRYNPWPFEIQGKDKHGKTIFYKEYKLGSNNIGEYLAIYHGLKYAETVYTDSTIALSWVKRWCKTQVDRDFDTEMEIIEADKFFKLTFWVMNRVKFWDTKTMWENPADFGRK